MIYKNKNFRKNSKGFTQLHFRLAKDRAGFTLIELLVVLALIGVLASISIMAFNSGKPRAKSRNLERKTEISLILNAVYQYATDNDGTFPASITTTSTEICKTGADSCAGLIDLGVLANNSEYLVELPTDPQGESANGAGYNILKTANGRITVSAPHAEDGVTISETR